MFTMLPLDHITVTLHNITNYSRCLSVVIKNELNSHIMDFLCSFRNKSQYVGPM